MKEREDREKTSKLLAGQVGVATFQGVGCLWEEMTWGGQASRVLFQTLSLKCKPVTQVEIWSRQ